MVCGLVLTLVLALSAGQPFYGRNVYGSPLGTYSTAAVLVIAGVIGIMRLVQESRRGPTRRG
jgi:hypothetical protein